MLVKAKCIRECFDSTACIKYFAGREYEIEHDGKVALLEVSRGHWAFQFDREAAAMAASAVPGETTSTPGNDISPAPAAPFRFPVEYKCKKCGEVFSTVNALGTHTRKMSHTADDIAAELQSIT